MQTEKRQHPRYSQVDLLVKVTRGGIVGFLKVSPASKCFDFSLSGILFGSKESFRVDDKLVLDLAVRDVELSEIPAVVVNSKQEDGGMFCTGVKFCFDSNRMRKPDIMHALRQIEDQLRVAREFPT